eukprot:CCRYP_013882-RA/>CCRYP_013882-RA protein AED:0.39 eAED:0.39 QI:280/1/1/1/1/1/2/163/321
MRKIAIRHFAACLLLVLLDCCLGFGLGRRRSGPEPPLHIHVMQLSPRSGRHLLSRTLMQSFNSNIESTSGNTDDRTVRILCLHGKGGSGEKFVNTSLEPLRRLIDNRLQQRDAHSRVSFQWDEITAPYKLPPGTSNVENDDDVGFAWWGLPQGVRSFNAVEYEGFHESESRVMDALYSYSNGNDCKYDIVLGHSQGAILTAALISTHNKLWTLPTSPKGFILNGAAWPNPFGDDMETMLKRVHQDPLKDSPLPPMLFIMGNSDNINPIESAKRVRDTFKNAGFNVTTVEHGGGHSVPYKSDDDSMRAIGEVADWIMSVVSI